jgi:WD40 repeat protein
MRGLRGLIAGVALLFTLAPAAHGAFPGTNGTVAFQRSSGASDPDFEIFNVSGTKLTNNTVDDQSPAYSPDGTKIAFVRGTGPNRDLWMMDANGAGQVPRATGAGPDLDPTWSPDGKQIAFASGRTGNMDVFVMDRDGKNVKRLTDHPGLDYWPSWSPDGKHIAFGCGDNSLRAIEAETGKQELFQGAHGDWVLATVFSQDNEHVVSVSRDMSMKLTVVKTQRFVDNVTSITPGALKGGLLAVDRRPMAKTKKVKGVDTQEKVYDELVVGGSDGAPRLYKMHRVVQRVIGDDANKIREYEKMPGRVFALRFSKDGSFFAAGSSLDQKGEVRVYETDTGKLRSRLDKVGSVYTVAVHPDGKMIASAGLDGTVRLSEAATGKVIKEFAPVTLERTAQR